MIYLRPYFMDKPIGKFTYRLDEISFTFLQIMTFLMITVLIGRCVYMIVTGVCTGYVGIVKEIENARAFWNRNETTMAGAERITKSQKTQQKPQLADLELRMTALERRVTEIERQNSETLQRRAQETQQRKRKKMEEKNMDHVLIERIEAVGWDA